MDAYLTKQVHQSQLFDCLTTVVSNSANVRKSCPIAGSQFVTKHTWREAKPMSDKLILLAEDNIVNSVFERFFAGHSPKLSIEEVTVHEVAPPVDLERLHEALGEDPEEIFEILNLYRTEMAENLNKLDLAIASGNAGEVEMIAHNCAGTSANCGMVAVVEPLRELERLGRTNQLAGAASLKAQVGVGFERIKRFLEERFEPLAAP
jgi:HPt (histidine-containing phosphotransfer) domain-containing protein